RAVHLPGRERQGRQVDRARHQALKEQAMKKTPLIATLAALATVAGCGALPGSTADHDKVADDMVKAAFRTQGIAKVERVTAIDETLKACNAADVAGKPLDPAVAKRLEEANFKAIKWPSDGKFLGDWKEGE